MRSTSAAATAVASAFGLPSACIGACDRRLRLGLWRGRHHTQPHSRPRRDVHRRPMNRALGSPPVSFPSRSFGELLICCTVRYDISDWLLDP